MSNKYDFYDLEKVEELAGRPETIEIDGYYWDPTDLPPKDYLDEHVPLEFKNIGKWMRSKMNGLQTRETMARLAEMVGINTRKAVDVVEENKVRQDTLEEQFDAIQRDSTGKDVVSSMEIVAARGGKATLGQRLDETTAQLAQTMLLSSDFGLIGDGTDETEKFQAMLNAAIGKQLKILRPQSKYKIGPVDIPSNLDVFFEDSSVFEITPGLPEGKKWIDFKEKRDIVFRGKNILFQMLKEEYTAGEHRHCFNFEGAENIELRGVIARGSGGDGFHVGKSVAKTEVTNKNIRMYDCVADDNKRQGMSVTTVEGLHVEKSVFKNTNGIAPRCGLDIEPNDSIDKLKNVRFVDCDFNDNAGRGVDIMLKHLDATSDFVDIEFENCRTNGNAYGFQPKYFNQGAKGIVKIIDCKSNNEKLNSVNSLSCHPESIRVIVENHVAVDCNRLDGTNPSNSYASSYLVSDTPEEFRESIGGIEFINCKSFDTKIPHLIRRGFATASPNGVPIKKVDFIDCESNGHTVSGFEIDLKTEDMMFRNQREEELILGSSSNLSTRYMNRVHTNASATGLISLTLPVAKNRFRFKFRVASANILKINPQPGSKLLAVTNEGSKSVESSLVGSLIELSGKSNGDWEVLNLIGSWTQSV